MARESIHNLPNEILGHVFDFAIDRNPTGLADPERSYSYLIPNQMDDTDCPRNIMLVCKHWHRIALQEVSIWTHLSSDKLLEPLPSASLMTYWLSLSRGAELRLCLREGHKFSMKEGAHTLHMIGRYTSQSHRVRSLEVHLSKCGLWQLFCFMNTNRNFIILDELQIYAHPEVKMKDLETLPSAINRLVSFRHLTLHLSDSWNESATQLSFSIPWKNLKSLDLRINISMTDATRLLGELTSATTIRLGQLSKLENTTTTTTEMEGSLPKPPAKITLPSLVHLSLHGRVHPTSLLLNFVFPNLVTLTITSGRPCSSKYQPLETLLSAQDCAHPKLRKIAIRNYYRCIPGELPNFVRATRALATVKEVSVSYTVASIYHLRDLDQLAELQVQHNSDGSPTVSAFPVPRLMVWVETGMRNTGPLDVYVGWLSDMSGCTLAAEWKEDGPIRYLYRPTSIWGP